MSNNIVKTGSCSIILGRGHFKNYLPIKKNKLVKVTKIIPRHNEFTHLSLIRTIENYDKHYSIPDEEIYTIQPTNDFYKYLVRLCQYEEMEIFGDTLNCFYIDYAGDKELLDSIIEMETRYDFSFWKSYKKILDFSKQIMLGIKFLHDKKLCHLDIKAENIMVNTRTSKFKIIDFGFCSKEPFTDFINDMKGTPGYFPKNFRGDNVTDWFPITKANDCVEVDGLIPMKKDSLLVYKIDSYCFGRVLNFLKYIYDDNKIYYCCNSESNKGKKLDYLINDLTEPNCWNRKTIKECLIEYFNTL